MEQNSWTKEDLQRHILMNIPTNQEKEVYPYPYGIIIILAAMYLKLYGELPKVGLSGFQGENAEQLAKLLPAQIIDIKNLTNKL